MKRWHDTRAAQVALRTAGSLLLLVAWFIGHGLYDHVHSHPPHDASPAELLVRTVIFLTAVIGQLLLVVGPGLWKQIDLPSPWHWKE